MQNKGAIRLFVIIFTLACLYQLSFTWVSRNVVKDAQEFAEGDAVKEQNYLDSISGEPVLNLFVKKFTYNEVKARELNLGLDLKGGMNVILEVSVKDIVKKLANQSKDPIFNKALASADELQKKRQDNYLTLFFEEFERISKENGGETTLSSPYVFGTKEINDRVGIGASDEEIKEVIREEADGAIDNVFRVLRARIDKFGVTQPNIQRLENSGRILVELPGVKEPERVKKLLQSTAKLEFWDVYHGAELLNFLADANTRLQDIVEKPASLETDVEEDTAANAASSIESILAIDDETSSEDASSFGEDTTASSVDSLFAAADSLGTDSADALQAFNPLFDVLVPNIDFQTNRPRVGPIVGFAQGKDTAKVNEYLNMPQVRNLLPAEMRYVKFMWANKPDEGTDFIQLFAIKANRQHKAPLEGDVVSDAYQDYDEYSNPVVTMRMNNIGAQKWRKLTKQASSETPKRSVAVVLDALVYSAPTVNEEIPTGSTQISGNFSINEAKDLANILKAGKLPAPARIIQADVVGPSLGQEAIDAGLLSFVIALVIVLLYMIFYYSKAGLISNVALIANMFFIIGALASMNAVLTLPGIAGIVLTIGMSVDANVLIL